MAGGAAIHPVDPQFADTQTALALAIVAKVPVLLTGLPGQGKTATINAIADQYGLLLRTLVASQREPADLNGLPYVDPASGAVQMLPQQWARDLVAASDGGGDTSSILFFDEISTAPPALQAACLRILGERVVGDLALPEDAAIVPMTLRFANPAGLKTATLVIDQNPMPMAAAEV